MNLKLMKRCSLIVCTLLIVSVAAKPEERLYSNPLNVNPPHISKAASVQYDYDIVYVRAPRHGDKQGAKWAEVGHPLSMEPGADLMLLHPDGSEEVLVRGG